MTSRLSRRSALVLACSWCLVDPSRAVADDSPLTIVDLEAYRVALATRAESSAPLVRFRDLWDRPEVYAGRPVRVEGRVARLFRQPRLGEFPPLVEVWVVSGVGDPFCLVFPQAEGRPTPELGTSIGFSGTFLRRIEYRGGDSSRVAPLIVGPGPPATLADRSEVEASSWSTTDWVLGLGASMVVATLLARRHLARPAAPTPVHGPPPEFLDGPPGSDQDEEANADECP